MPSGLRRNAKYEKRFSSDADSEIEAENETSFEANFNDFHNLFGDLDEDLFSAGSIISDNNRFQAAAGSNAALNSYWAFMHR